jgi:Zn-dependent alcohol dehydrogenase
MGPVEINPNRHICTKGVSVLGIGGETLEQYGPSLAMLARHQERLPFARAITHEVGLEQVEDALALAQTGAAMKVLVAPNGAG